MAALFRNEMHSDFVWARGEIPYGGVDFGEIRAVAEAPAEGGDDVFTYLGRGPAFAWRRRPTSCSQRGI